MLYCPRCDISKPGKCSYAVCEECGGRFSFIKESSRGLYNPGPEDFKELILGDNGNQGKMRSNEVVVQLQDGDAMGD